MGALLRVTGGVTTLPVDANDGVGFEGTRDAWRRAFAVADFRDDIVVRRFGVGRHELQANQERCVWRKGDWLSGARTGND